MFASLGDLLTDVTVVPTAPAAPGDDTPATIRIGGGGQDANWCAWVAHMGGRARLITRVGADAAGHRLIGELEAAGVEVCAARGGGPTGAIVALVGAGGERSFYAQRGAVLGLTPAELRREWLEDVELLHLPLYSLLVEPLASAARQGASWGTEGGARLAVDLSSPAGIRALGAEAARSELAALRAELLFATEAEAAAIGGALDELAEVAVVKLGADGCRIGQRRFPAPVVEAVDAKGAGDAFAAAYCLTWVGTSDVAASAEAANRAGADAVRRLGGRP